MSDLIKDILCSILLFLSKNDSFKRSMAVNKAILRNSPRITRFILALAQQCRLKYRSNYKRIQRGSVKGVWFGKEAAYKSEVELTSGSGPIVLYIHGGAFISGQTKMWSDFHVDIMDEHKKKYSKDLRFFNVDYTLAPDKSFPHQFTECQAATDYLIRTMNVDPARLFISGDSAGGNLALLSIFEMEAAKNLAGSILFSPWVSPAGALVTSGKLQDPNAAQSTGRESWVVNADNDYVTDAFGETGFQCYIGKSMTYETAFTSKQINPILRNADEFENLPDLLVVYGTGERLRDQIEEFVEKAKASANSVEVLTQDGGVHDWPLGPRLTPEIAQYRRGLESISAWIERKMIHTSLPLERS